MPIIKKDELDKLPIYPKIDIINGNLNNNYEDKIENFNLPYHYIVLLTYIKKDNYYIQFKKEITAADYINYLEFLSFVDRFKVDVFRIINMDAKEFTYKENIYYIKEE